MDVCIWMIKETNELRFFNDQRRPVLASNDTSKNAYRPRQAAVVFIFSLIFASGGDDEVF